MNTTQTLSATDVAQQFKPEVLAPRTEIWSKDVERSTPSVPSALNDSN